MSYIGDICNVLEENGHISHEAADRVRAKFCLKYVRCESSGEEVAEADEEDWEELLPEVVEAEDWEEQWERSSRGRRAAGGRPPFPHDRRAIKAPDLNLLVAQRIKLDENKWQVLAKLAMGQLNAPALDWSHWSQCIEQLYALQPEALCGSLKVLLNQSVVNYVLGDTIAQFLSLYEGVFWGKEHLSDVCGPSVTKFLNVMQNDFDVRFTTGEKNNWLFADAPNLVIMRHALIVRNRLRTGMTALFKSLEELVERFLEEGCRARLSIPWKEFQERGLTLEEHLSDFLDGMKLDRQALVGIFGPFQGTTNLFVMNLIRQWFSKSL